MTSERLEDGHAVLRLRSDFSELGRVRRFASAAANRFGLDERDREDFTLVASEAVANAIEHGGPCRDGAIHVWTLERAGTLTLVVRNGGHFACTPRSLDPLAERGRGLGLIADLVDEMALKSTDGHMQLELTKERPG